MLEGLSVAGECLYNLLLLCSAVSSGAPPWEGAVLLPLGDFLGAEV